MKVLFVCSGNKPLGINQIVSNQGMALSKFGIQIDYFVIRGKGFFGYLKNYSNLKKKICNQHFDIIHAHFSYSAFLSSLVKPKYLVVSLMGSDVNKRCTSIHFVKIFNFVFRWRSIIVKSNDMKLKLGIKKSIIIPNGVDIIHFKPINKIICLKKLNWDPTLKHILFASSSLRPEKNFKLALDAYKLLNDSSIIIHILENIAFEEMPFYYNAADLILLTSLWEGSPNVIKEAMACNRPIVSTDVGDVRKLLGNLQGCFIAKHDPEDVSKKILQALQFKHSINTRQRIIDLGLEINETSRKIKEVYEDVLEGRKKKN